ncbi:MAG: HAD family hydrolase [Christensenellales bacterium]|jgi:2-hydroxy-3-keto-5-methylthiopentenyl-1-phosphate phosphatase
MRETPIVALIYDFDKTLSPRDMQEYGFIPSIDMEPARFWDACRERAEKHSMDGVLAYMLEMHCRTKFTKEMLNKQGETIGFYPGVETWFPRIDEYGRSCGVEVEHYIISSGLKEIIDGTAIANRFKAVFAASFVYGEDGYAIWPATAVNYTSKTQYLFRINKGILDVTNDEDLNGYTPERMRRVPFSDMIYVGDGLTDVPCMKLTKLKGGYSVVVHTPDNARTADNMLLQGRADYAVPADYTQDSELERVVQMLIRRIREHSDCVRLHQEQLTRARVRRKRLREARHGD